MPISQSYIDGLTRQVFIRDYILNGLFPCQSDVVRSIRHQKKEWNYNDKFEYRMLLSTTNTGGTLNSQIFKENVGLLQPGELDYGIFKASYGTISDGFNVDMAVNLETKNSKAAFVTDYATRLHSMRVNVASLFKNFAIHGRFGVVHQIAVDATQGMDNVAESGGTSGPIAGTPFTLNVPINVFVSGFKRGRYLIKTAGAAAPYSPWDAANINEVYMVIDNQPKKLTLVAIPGSIPTAWAAGQYLETYGNRTFAAGGSLTWGSPTTITYAGQQVRCGQIATATGVYTSGAAAGTGAMEGLADLFPWYTDPTAPATRLGLDMPFRDQPNRLAYSTEQAGGFVSQEAGEDIIDAIMRGVALTTATVPTAEIGVWMNPDTRQAIGYQAPGTDGLRTVRELVSSGPIVWQRGITQTSYAVSSKVIPDVISDYNIPTDVIVIGPKNDISYNSWGNTLMKIDEFIHETFGKEKEPKIEELSVPEEFSSKLDIGSRITYGAPYLTDGAGWPGSQAIQAQPFVHPGNYLPIAVHEMGALFTEYPYTYTIVKLQKPILDPSKV